MTAIPADARLAGEAKIDRDAWPAWVTLFASLFVAAVLLTASLAKLVPQSGGGGFPSGEAFSAHFGYLKWHHFVIIIAQVLISIAVIRWHRRQLTWIGVMALFAAFAGYSGYAHVRGISCGCFGTWLESGTVVRLDLFAILLGGVLAWRPGKATASFASLATIAMGIGTAGAASAVVFLPPPPVSDTAERFMALPIMEEVRNAGADDPAYLLYIYSEECPVCQEHLPPMQAYMDAHTNDDTLRLKTISMEMLNEEYGIQIWEWDAKPTTLLVQGGAITKSYSLNDLPVPETLRSSLSGEMDPFAMLLELDLMNDLTQPSGSDPATLVYLYNPNCPTCIEHLVHFEDYQAQRPDDRVMRVRMISMLDLESDHGIPLYLWTPPQTILMQGGRITERFDEHSTPDPYEVVDSLSGM